MFHLEYQTGKRYAGVDLQGDDDADADADMIQICILKCCKIEEFKCFF